MKVARNPTWKNGILIPSTQRRNKSTCIQAFLCKWFVPSKTHDLTFVMDYEILEKE